MQCLCLSDLGTADQPSQGPGGKPPLLTKEKWQRVTFSQKPHEDFSPSSLCLESCRTCVQQPAQQDLLLHCHGLTLGHAVIYQSQQIRNKKWVLKKAEETKLPDFV